MPPQPSYEGFECVLDTCRKNTDAVQARLLYVYMRKNGLDAQHMLCSHLVRLLSHVGIIHEACQVYDSLPHPKTSALHSLIKGCMEFDMPCLALTVYKTSQKQRPSYLNGRSFVILLKACVKANDVESGRILHEHVVDTEILKQNNFVASALVDMYCKFGLLAKVKTVFDGLPKQDVVTWTTLIAGYAENGLSEEALSFFADMEQEGVCPNGATFVCVLKACTNMEVLEKGRDIHAEIERRGLLQGDILVGNALVDMYARCSLLTLAEQILDRLPVRDLVSWTTLITGYSDNGNNEKAMYCFELMQLEGIYPDSLTYASVVKAYSASGAIKRGRALHSELEMKGLLERDAFIGTALVAMYAKCGSFVEALQLFDGVNGRDAVSWNSLISGLSENGFGMEAIRCYEQMQLECILPNSVSFACTLKACGDVVAILKGKEIHARVHEKKSLVKDAIVITALVDMYAKVCLLGDAKDLFDQLPSRDVATWNSMIIGCAEQDLGDESLKFFEQMQLEGVSPNNITFVCILKACGILGAAEKGEDIHADIERRGFFDKDIVGNALVYMYAKCGWLVKAQQVFNVLVLQDAVAWTALMAGYAQLGEMEHVFHIFDRMLIEGIKPSLVTFIIILNSCSLSGFLKDSETYFERMSEEFGIPPAPHHYTCLIDMYSRVGQLDRAVSKIKEMPWESNLVSWHAVIEACKYFGNFESANKAFELAVIDRTGCCAFPTMQPSISGNVLFPIELDRGETLKVIQAY